MMDIINNITEDNFPAKIVGSMVTKIIVAGQNRRIKVFISDDLHLYSAKHLSLYLGLAKDGLSRRERDYGFDHEYFLAKRIEPSEKKAGDRRNNSGKNSSLGKMSRKSKPFNSNVLTPFERELLKEKRNVSVITIPPPPKPISGDKVTSILARFNAKMERDGYSLPSGHYNSFSGKMIDGPKTLKETA